MKKAEIIIVILAIIGLILNLLIVPGGGLLTVLSFSLLSVFYMYLSFAIFNSIRLKDLHKKESYIGISRARIIGAVGVGLALSITAAGIMFKFQSWPGAGFNLGAGLFGLIIVTIVALIKYSKNKSDYYKRIFKRVALFGGLALILIIIPKVTWIEFKYRNHPAYLNALKNAIADPENTSLWEKVDEERLKMDEGK